GDPAMNFRLRLAMDKARQANMPTDNVDRAVKKGLGIGADGVTFEEIVYEGYGPGGAAIMLKVLTDNRNRTAAEVRAAFSRGGGNLGDAGSVAWIFESRAVVTVESLTEAQAEELALAAIDAGAEDVKAEADTFEVYTTLETLERVRQALEENGAKISLSELQMVAKTTMQLDAGLGKQTLRLLDNLEELDDVQRVFTNADFPEEALVDTAD
ncbi:MAG: YebC/PmpR family DNA-binding transcriptional regulator, partial [Chloroflexi bacterium]|nr:YebC/PmpR family DNA-binding transcriptional regulator [Chloroflexota bacterium]